MTCNACGEKPKNTAKDFTKAVIEINNPETLVLLRKVVIPASMGDEEQVPPAIGKYHNVLLQYEANDHIYLYSSDGIPTAIITDIPQEVLDSIEELEDDVVDLQEQIDDLKNSPDVVDIVATYADLQTYDTSKLGDNDIVRVLADEQHDGESSYYRWNTTTQTWTFIGATGPYYTKDETDTLIKSAKTVWSGTETTSSSSGTTAEVTTTSGDFKWEEGNTVTVSFAYKTSRSSLKIDSETAYSIDNVRSLSGGIDTGVAIQYVCTTVGGNRAYRPIGRLRASSDVAGPVFIADNLTTGNVGLTALSAYQGKVLKDMIDNLPSGPTVVQTPGNSQTDVMSQNAATSMVFADPTARTKVRIGNTGTVGHNSMSIGYNADASSTFCLAIGINARAQSSNSTAIGDGASTGSNLNSVALGYKAATTRDGEVNVGVYNTNAGYNNTPYRVIGGVYDGQDTHDVATVGQLDGRVLQNAGAPTTATVGTVGQLLEDTTNGKLYQCTVVDTTDPDNPSYTWDAVGGGGGLITLSYGISTWQDFIDAYNGGKIVYCRASSNSNPATGSQTRMAFMAYINNPTSPTEVEFQYVRSVSTKTAAQQMDQVFVYKLTSANDGTWTVTTRDMTSKVVAGTGLSSAYSNGTLTLSVNEPSTGSSAPTTATSGSLGSIYIDTSTDDAYMCVKVSGNTYTWKQITN